LRSSRLAAAYLSVRLAIRSSRALHLTRFDRPAVSENPPLKARVELRLARILELVS
jgi:hypothetical protein